jgi:hypothetical protein
MGGGQSHEFLLNDVRWLNTSWYAIWVDGFRLLNFH